MSGIVKKDRELQEEIVHLDESRTLPVAPVKGHKGRASKYAGSLPRDMDARLHP
jgi:hypothetical protein